MRKKCVLNGIYWGKVVNLSVNWLLNESIVILWKSLSFKRYPLISIALSSLAFDLPPFTLIKCLERDFSMTYFCINNAYVSACYLLCPLPGSALMTWWLPWQRFIETFTEVSKPKYMFHAVLNGVYIIYESMYRFEYIDTYQCSAMKCYPQDVYMSMKC